jgi:excisionase family DNA binding protein
MTTPKPVLNLKEAADFLGLSVPTVRQMAENGELPGKKMGAVGTRWRFLRSALEDYLRQPANKAAA